MRRQGRWLAGLGTTQKPSGAALPAGTSRRRCAAKASLRWPPCVLFMPREARQHAPGSVRLGFVFGRRTRLMPLRGRDSPGASRLPGCHLPCPPPLEPTPSPCAQSHARRWPRCRSCMPRSPTSCTRTTSYTRTSSCGRCSRPTETTCSQSGWGRQPRGAPAARHCVHSHRQLRDRCA